MKSCTQTRSCIHVHTHTELAFLQKTDGTETTTIKLIKSSRLPGCTICRVNEGRNIKGLLFLFSPSSQSEQKHCTGHSIVVIRLSLNNERLHFYRVFVTGNFSLWTRELFCPNETQKSEKGTSVADVLWSNIHMNRAFAIGYIQYPGWWKTKHPVMLLQKWRWNCCFYKHVIE